MRKISARPSADGGPAALCLNDRALYLRGALHQSFYPEGVYTAGDARTLREDIAFAKQAGFDFLRIHIKIDDPLLLHYADTLGMLLMTDFPNFGEGGDTPLGRARFEAMMRAAVERDFNHPAIIAWCMFNETWGFGGQVELMKWIEEHNLKARDETAAAADQPKEAPPAPAATGQDGGQPQDPATQPPAPFKIHNESAHKWVQQMWQAAKALDPTRLIEDMSVVYWEHLDYYAHTETDINSWHFYINDYEKARAHIDNVARSTYAGSRFNYVPGFEQGSAPLITSEYGGVGALDGDVDISYSFKFLTNELRRQPKLSAYVFTQLHDVEWEYNGFLNYDRTPKDFGYDPRIINAPDVLPIDAAPARRAAPGERVARGGQLLALRRDRVSRGRDPAMAAQRRGRPGAAARGPRARRRSHRFSAPAGGAGGFGGVHAARGNDALPADRACHRPARRDAGGGELRRVFRHGRVSARRGVGTGGRDDPARRAGRLVGGAVARRDQHARGRPGGGPLFRGRERLLRVVAAHGGGPLAGDPPAAGALRGFQPPRRHPADQPRPVSFHPARVAQRRAGPYGRPAGPSARRARRAELPARGRRRVRLRRGDRGGGRPAGARDRGRRCPAPAAALRGARRRARRQRADALRPGVRTLSARHDGDAGRMKAEGRRQKAEGQSRRG